MFKTCLTPCRTKLQLLCCFLSFVHINCCYNNILVIFHSPKKQIRFGNITLTQSEGKIYDGL